MIQRFLAIVTLFAWALWFGALVTLFLFVTTLFHNDREIAVQAAPQLFVAFQKYHLIVATIALVALVAWRIVSRSKMVLAIFILLGLAACCGVAVAVWIIGPMEALREPGFSGSAEFKRLHGLSMMLYSAQALLLLVSGIVLPFAIASDGKKAGRTDRGTGSPA